MAPRPFTRNDFPELPEHRVEWRLDTGKGQPPPDLAFYKSSSEESIIVKGPLVRGYNIHLAQWDELEHFTKRWLIDNKATDLNLNQKSSHYQRGDLMEAMEAKFSFLTDKAIPRAWRDQAIRCFIVSMVNDFKTGTTNADPATPSKKRRVAKGHASKQDKAPTYSLLAYCKIIVHGNREKSVIWLRDLVDENRYPVLDDNWNLSFKGVSFKKLQQKLGELADIDYNPAGSRIFIQIQTDAEDSVIVDDSDLAWALVDARPRDNIYNLYVRQIVE